MKTVIYFLLVVVVTILFLVPYTLMFCLTFWWDKNRKFMHKGGVIGSKIIFGINPFWKVELKGAENINPDEVYVVVTNHSSFFDIPLQYYIPMQMKWVAKKAVTKIPLFGWIILMHQDILIDRSSASIKKVLSEGKKYLDRGVSVTIFPEGTRSKNGKVGTFKDGAFMLAKRSEVAILPCIIEGTSTMTKGKFFVMPHKFTLTILPPVSEEIVKETEVKELKNKVRELYN